MKIRFALLLCLLLGLFSMPVWGGSLLADADIPRSVDFLPAPPAEGATDMARDKALYERTRAAKGTERWLLAARDADIRLDRGAGELFTESFGLKISREGTPATYALLHGVFPDLIASFNSAKERYMRIRPFVYYNAPGSTCTPAEEEHLSGNGSYPSGHSTLGYGMALVLAEISPERQNAIIKRGIEIGQSRVICGAHWQSDVDAGRLVAAATMAQLHNSEEFCKLMAKAKEEIRRIRLLPARDAQ